MKYVDQVLASDERILAVGKFHWWYTFAAYLWLGLLGVFLIGIAVFVKMMLRKWTTEIAVTTNRLIYKTGWIARHTEEISLARIEEINLSQTVMGRIFGYGGLRISGSGGSVITLPRVLSHPLDFRRALEEGREEARGPR